MSSAQVDGFNDRKGLKTTTSPHFLKKTRGEKGEWESCTSLQIILPFLSAIITVSMTSSAVSMGSRSFILWNPNQGTERKPAPSHYEKSHWETHSQWWMLHACKGVSACTKPWNNINSYENSNKATQRSSHTVHWHEWPWNLGRRYDQNLLS